MRSSCTIRNRCASLNTDPRNDLWFVAVENLKIFFLQIAHGAALHIADDYWNKYGVDAYLYLRAVVLKRRFSHLLCRGARAQNATEATHNKRRGPHHLVSPIPDT